MDVISAARELGRALQQDERYIKMSTARQNSDDDAQLQEMIGNFNLKRLAINNEAAAETPDNDKIQALNEELRGIYNNVMSNENMSAFNEAKKEVDDLLQGAMAIISMCADGEDPDKAEYKPEANCGGDCGSCGGCH